MDPPPEAWAERRDGLVSALAKGTDGVTRNLFRTRTRYHRWTRMRRGVAKVSGSPPTWRQSVRAACLSGGDQAFIFHLTAPAFYEVENTPGAFRRHPSERCASASDSHGRHL